jgi:hypothetical protein
MIGALRLALLVPALAILFALAGCGDDDGGSTGTATADTGYIERANAICRDGVREARRIGRSSSGVNPGDLDTVTAIFVRPGIALLERQAERLRRLDAPADAEAFNRYVALYDPANVLVRQRVRLATAGKLGEAQGLGTSMDQLAADSRAAALEAGLDDCDVDISREIVLAAAGQ